MYTAIDTRAYPNMMHDATRPYAVVYKRTATGPFVRVLSRHETMRGARIAAEARNRKRA